MSSGISPFDIILTWKSKGAKENSLVIEIDGSTHYYNFVDRIPNQSTQFKYRMMDLYRIPYLTLECWDY